MPYSKAQKLRRKLYGGNKSPARLFLELIEKERRELQNRANVPPNGRTALIAARKARRSDPNAYGTNGRPQHLKDRESLEDELRHACRSIGPRPTHFLEEGERCECGGVAVFRTPQNCSCHISPPCNACVDNTPQCEKCGSYVIED